MAEEARNKPRYKISLNDSVDDEHVIQATPVLDFDLFGELIGIEILNYKFVTGLKNLSFEHTNKGIVRISFDEQADALYLKILNERSSDQETANGNIIVDSRGKLIRLEVIG